MLRRFFYVSMICALCTGFQVASCNTLSGLDPQKFESTVAGKPTKLYVLKNKNGVEACITNFGGRLVSLMVPDKNGTLTDVVLGHDNIKDYVSIDGNFGALIGRYGNRIGNAQFVLDGTTYKLPKNNDEHCLHGGPDGYHNVVWEAKQLDDQTLQLTYTSPDGDAGFPGKLDMTVIYRLTDKNAVDIQYKAVTDKKTIVNLTNHSYFNLSGKHNENILDHVLMINADTYTPIDDTFITTGEIAQVVGTPMDFRKPNVIGDRIDDSFQQLQYGKGYDHNWVLNTKGNLKQAAAQAYSKESGIVMSVYTTEPGIQFYAGNFMEGDIKGKQGVVYPHRGALCLETQHYPDSPNKESFPSVVVKPGDVYTSRCIYSFGVQK